MYYETEALENMPYWRDVGTGNTAVSSSWTSIGTISIAADSNKVTGTGFNTNVELRDVLNLADTTSPSGGDGAIVISILSDTELLIDRTFDSAKSSITGYRAGYRADYEIDAALAVIRKDTSDNFTAENFLTIDPKLEAARTVVIDVDVQNLTYDSSSTQTNSPSDINATVTALGFADPEFKIVIPAGLSAAGTQDFASSTGDDSFVQTYVLDDDGAVAYSSGSNLAITASVREKNNPSSTVVSSTFTLTKTKDGTDGTDGSDGVDGADGSDGSAGAAGRVVNLTAGTQAFTYTAAGSTPNPTSTTITATAVNTTGNVFYEFFLNDTSVQGPTQDGTTYTYTPQSSESNMPDKVEVQIREGSASAAIVARDQMTMIGVKPGTDGTDGDDGADAFTVALTNEAHTLSTTNTGTVTYTGSGTDIIAYKGSTELNGITSGTPTTGQFKVTASGTDITPSSTNGTSTGNPVVFADHNSMTENTASITYSINLENTTTLTKIQSFAKSIEGADGGDGTNGTDGNDGNSIAQVYCYRRATSTPSTPSGGSFNFTNNTLTAPTDWSATVPSGSDPVYISFATASISGSVGTDSSLTWSTPVLAFQNGADGSDGTDGTDGTNGSNGSDGSDGKSTFQGVVFRRAASAPSTPSGGSFNFGNNTFTAPTNWSTAIPSGTNPVYASRALFQVTGDSGTDSSPSWSTPQVLAQNGDDGTDGTDGTNGTDGADGADGVSTFHFSVFKRSASAPSTPSGGSYNFTDQTRTAPSGWNTEPPATDGNPLYQASTVASVTGATGTDSSLTWSAPVKLVEDGSDGSDGNDGNDGNDGANGLRTVQGYLYYEKTTSGAPSAPTEATYTFSSGDINGGSGATEVLGLSDTSATDKWTNEPRTQDPSSSNTHYSIRYYGTETAADSSTLEVTYSGVVQHTDFSGVVTFSNGTFSEGSTNITSIDGGNISTGTIDADSLVIGNRTIGAATSTLKLYSDAIKIFNSGNLRVKIGNLSNTTDE